MSVNLSGALSRGIGSGDANSGVSISGTLSIDVVSAGVQQPRVSFSLRNYTTPSDTLPIQEAVAHFVTVSSPGFVEVKWSLFATCATRLRAATERAGGGVQLSYTVTR
jgi:hypothetical protein